MKISDMSVELIDYFGSDLHVVNAARVSFHKESWWEQNTIQDVFGNPSGFVENKLTDKDTKLINYLAKHNHKSPFNHCFLSFRVKAPIFVARQLVKHEYLPWNEVSRRYVDEEPEFYFPKIWRGRSDSVKQGSSDKESGWEVNMSCLEEILFWYTDAIKNGVAPEQARMILPQNMMTEWIWSGSLFAFVKMIKLRLDSHTQKETQEVAERVAYHVANLFPVSYFALMGDPVGN